MTQNTKAPFPVMEHMTVKMVRKYLERKQSILVPLGVTEQHGYHLPLSTDALIATHLGRRIGAAADVLVAPTINTAYSGGGLPGTINVSPSVMSLVVSDVLVSLVSQGFRQLYLYLCHGGSENLQALDNALRLLLRLNPAFDNVLIALLPCWKFDPEGIGWTKAIEEGDWHAGWLETSLVLALEPDLVRLEELEMDIEPVLSELRDHPDRYQRAEKIVDDPYVVPRMSQRPEVRVGVMGYPERASRELGLRLVDTMVSGTATKVMDLETKGDGVYRDVEFTPEPIIL